MCKNDWRPAVGTRVLITGKHPHSGKTGTVYMHERTFFGADGMRVRCDDGSNAGVTKPENIQVLDD